jgi:hypothetical protein
MNQEELAKRATNFTKTASRLFNTPDGVEVLAFLKDSYVNNTALTADTNQTMYKLGQKEFVQSMVRLVTEPEELDRIIVKNNISED